MRFDDVAWSTTVKSVMCACCWDPIPVDAKTLLCPPCFQALTAEPPVIKCTLHRKTINTEEITQ